MRYINNGDVICNMMTELFYEHLMKGHGKDPTGMCKVSELCY